MHDYSRDIMLATTQEHIEIRMSLAAVESRSKEMALQMRRLDEVQKKTDELLYQMIPRSVAERLRSGQGQSWVSVAEQRVSMPVRVFFSGRAKTPWTRARCSPR